MTVEQLIERLQASDPDFEVFLESDGQWYHVSEVRDPKYDFEKGRVTIS